MMEIGVFGGASTALKLEETMVIDAGTQGFLHTQLSAAEQTLQSATATVRDIDHHHPHAELYRQNRMETVQQRSARIQYLRGNLA
ncbi:hypothetical protein [Nocardia jiangsuensis]|uniref:Uncharacterized protein n=1 Tax=Nocardia jiangsuensis TaxID=1691563 RepID=A0ABV8E271_9NOCA